jgi:hypothetical protein
MAIKTTLKDGLKAFFFCFIVLIKNMADHIPKENNMVMATINAVELYLLKS